MQARNSTQTRRPPAFDAAFAQEPESRSPLLPKPLVAKRRAMSGGGLGPSVPRNRRCVRIVIPIARRGTVSDANAIAGGMLAFQCKVRARAAQ